MTVRKLTQARSWKRLGGVGLITCGLLGAGAATALADSTGQQINHHSPGAAYSVTADPSMMGQMKQEWIQSASWKHNPEGWTLVVTPTAWARQNLANPTAGDAGWAELYSKYKDKDRGIHTNINGMKDQFRCHVGFAFFKPTWHLDEWRPDVGYPRTIAAGCNPGKPGD
jgi:hypothetical protein